MWLAFLVLANGLVYRLLIVEINDILCSFNGDGIYKGKLTGRVGWEGGYFHNTEKFTVWG